jgi:transposase
MSLDIAKSVFQVHGVDTAGEVVIRRQLKRRYGLAFFQKLPSCVLLREKQTSSPSAAVSGPTRTSNFAVWSRRIFDRLRLRDSR